MGVGAGLYMCDVVKKFMFAISSPDEFLFYIYLYEYAVLEANGKVSGIGEILQPYPSPTLRPIWMSLPGADPEGVSRVSEHPPL